ncbi:hypothetical protein [Caballeronia humi]|jgi:hypothetical protein|uniref:Uncharacterized protein n=1 Tax=Caballeronia humi TaxID=326474 RepID=A0A158J169_9BURK|nr:hypothetical protein [Caballeronia humi]SAL62070.1 hypothetical protein AWB65_05689 [Caballeronia humi]
MKAQQLALERIRKSINTADALNMKSSAVLVADLHVLMDMVDRFDLEEWNADSRMPREALAREE